MSDLLLDTCAVIWTGNGDPISEDATQALNATFRDGHHTMVSPFTAWELGMLVSRARLRLTRPVPDWFDDYIERGQLILAELSPRILVESSFLPGNPPVDPADRIILATARAHNLNVITRDSQILAYAAEGHVKAIAC